MTSAAFATVFPWFPTLLSFIATLFAFSTMISWSYYGEQCWAHLFGVRSILVYQRSSCSSPGRERSSRPPRWWTSAT